jgi:hypothetical protein
VLRYHNIVGRIPKRGLIGRVVSDSDGIVDVESAHLDDVASEIEVPSDHVNIHRHPRSVYEVRRILLEHLAELQAPPSSPLERLPITADARSATAPRVPAFRSGGPIPPPPPLFGLEHGIPQSD